VNLLSDDALMAIVSARGDSTVFGELVGRWQQHIAGLCLRLTGNLQDAEDAAQETFAKIFASRQQFRGDSKFATWAWRIAINAAHDVRRNSSRVPVDSEFPLTSLTSSFAPPINVTEHRELTQSVSDALSQLPEELRAVVVLRHYQQLKFREIADVLNIPMGTVCSRMTDALNRLSPLLKNLIKPDSL
jgi:RNA polymerase sigma-70 factor (ECF subfamily)